MARTPDPEKLNALMGHLVGDLGAALTGALVLLGDHLGLYKAMADGKPRTPKDIAKKTKLKERYVREWLSAQAAAGLVDYDAASGTFSLSPEQAMALAAGRQPRLLRRRVPGRAVDVARRAESRRRVQVRQGRRLAPALDMPVQGHGAVLPPRL